MDTVWVSFTKFWFPSREQSEVFKSIFVLCPYATHTFILSVMLNWYVEGNLTLHFPLFIVIVYVNIEETCVLLNYKNF
jgi:hypothetical protein